MRPILVNRLFFIVTRSNISLRTNLGGDCGFSGAIKCVESKFVSLSPDVNRSVGSWVHQTLNGFVFHLPIVSNLHYTIWCSPQM